jgi:hypothetical protein
MPAKDIDEGFYGESGNINKMTFQGRQVVSDKLKGRGLYEKVYGVFSSY